jgi:hypothetical protein
MITQEELKRVLHYDPDTGVFTRRVTLSSKAKAGDIVGTNMRGYLQVCIHGKQYRLHRLAWLYVYGVFPEHETDHINGNK